MNLKTHYNLLLLLLAAALPVFILLQSCSKAKDLTAFDVVCNLPRASFSYPVKNRFATDITVYQGKIKIPLDSILSANHIPSGLIASAYLSRLKMVITDPPEATFNWLSAIQIVGSQDSLFTQPRELGSATGIDPLARTIDLTVNNVDLKPMIRTDTYFLKVVATPSGQVPASSINMYLDSQIRLHIEPL